MHKFITVACCLVIMIFSINLHARAGSELNFDIGVHASMMNSYTRGTLDDWFAAQTGDPTDQVDAGSPSFFMVEADWLFPSDASFTMGMGLSAIIPPSHSLWGTNLYYSSRQELALSPQIISFSLPCKILLAPDMGMYLKIRPALLMGWDSGTYSSSTSYLEFVPAPGFGFGLSGGMDIFFAETIGLNFTLGTRFVQTALCFKNPASETGFSQPLLSNGEKVFVDLSGTYITFGLLFHL